VIINGNTGQPLNGTGSRTSSAMKGNTLGGLGSGRRHTLLGTVVSVQQGQAGGNRGRIKVQVTHTGNGSASRGKGKSTATTSRSATASTRGQGQGQSGVVTVHVNDSTKIERAGGTGTHQGSLDDLNPGQRVRVHLGDGHHAHQVEILSSGSTGTAG
jgi:hypothetical protein